MPLPDERPRQSVANLIGRFEQQTKRQSLTQPLPSRTSSVTSHNTGDSAKEELKEKREWPPRPKLTTSASSSNVAGQPREDENNAVSPAHRPSAYEEVKSDPVPSPPETAVPVPMPKPKPVRQSSVGSVIAPRTPSKTAGRPSTAPSRAPARTPAKSPPTSFHGTPASSTSTSTSAKHTTPSRSQPATTPTRPRPSSRASQVTPGRAKTPSLRPKTPSASNMTATTTPAARPKTPASGLFAPTAASLAKARNAISLVPMPNRKPATGVGALDRLSKPTAASLSKARSPAPATVASPIAREQPEEGAAKEAVRGSAVSTRGASGRTRGAAAVGAKAKVAPAASTPAAPAAGLETAHDAEQHEHTEESDGLSSPVEHAEGVHEQANSESTLIDEQQDASAPENAEVVFSLKQEDLAADEVAVTSVEETVARDEVDAELPAAADEPEAAEPEAVESEPQQETEPFAVEVVHTELEAPDVPVNGKTTPTPAPPASELEDIINMLEAKPRVRPLSMAIPDEVMEIPDED